MSVLLWMLLFGLLMSCIALVGGITLTLREDLWQVSILPLIAFAAGSLIGGATFHMTPAAISKMGNTTTVCVWLNAGFLVFYCFEEFLHWHHSHTHVHVDESHSSTPQSHQHPSLPLDLHRCETARGKSQDPCPTSSFCGASVSIPRGIATVNECAQTLPKDVCHGQNDNSECDVETASAHSSVEQVVLGETQVGKESLNWLMLIADGLHNLLGGMFVGAAFVEDVNLGLSAWVAAAAHEIPQELGDFAILVHGGWTKRKALLFNLLSALTFLLGGLIACATSKNIDVTFLIPFAAGNFVYVGASDLIPEVKHHEGVLKNAMNAVSFTAGLGLLLGTHIAFNGW